MAWIILDDVADGVTTSEAARRLGSSKPTVRALLEKGSLTGQQLPRGGRFSWRVDEESLDRFLAEHGRYEGRRAGGNSRLGKIEAELSFLRDAVRALGGAGVAKSQAPAEAVERERDDLRAHVVNLEEVLTRAYAVAKLQHDVDAERAAVVEHLLEAAAASERAYAMRRDALANLHEALAALLRPEGPGRGT